MNSSYLDMDRFSIYEVYGQIDRCMMIYEWIDKQIDKIDRKRDGQTD